MESRYLALPQMCITPGSNASISYRSAVNAGDAQRPAGNIMSNDNAARTSGPWHRAPIRDRVAPAWQHRMPGGSGI